MVQHKMMKLIYFAAFLHIISLVYSQHQYDSDAWNNAANYLKQAMNKKEKPCVNFYDHICGLYGTNNDTSYETTLAGKASAVATILAKAIKDINLENPKTPKYQKAVKIFYDQCTSVELDSKWPKRLYDAIAARIGGLPLFENSTLHTRPFNAWRLMGQIDRQLGESMVVDSAVDYVEIGCQQKPELQLEPTLPPSEVAFNATDIRTKILLLGQAVNLNQSDLESNVDLWLDDIVKLYKDWKSLNTTGDGDRIALNNISTVLPNFDWRAYFEGLLPENVRQNLESDPNTKIYVSDLELMENVGQMLNRHSEKSIRLLTFLKVFYSIQQEYFGELDEEYQQLIAEAKTAKERCLEYALRHLAPAVARLYFDAIKVNILNWRHEIQMLGRNIFSAFRFLLNSVDWLDSEDKEKIQEKVDQITFNPGIPSWIGNETKVMARIVVYNTSLNPFENEFHAAETISDQTTMALISEEEEKDTEPNPSFEVNAEYDPNANQINMFLGLMVPPLFNITYPLPVKYGGLGVVIGHELMHAFDADGIYSGASDDHEWLKAEAFREFNKKKDCLVRQYSRYCYKDKGLCVSGEKTIGENIADIDGIKVAYTAYKIVTQVLGVDPPIPDMVQYTDDQIFFLSFARTWCSKGTPSWIDLQDAHTPNRPRVEAAIRNVPLFARAFQCPVGTKYAPLKRCSLWGDLEEPVKRVK